ncbi:MAG TPA: pilin [Candidatus Saccharibacteria bacterium]|nr:pilin [Candidatus Saccharibacteria bacterium]
MKNIARFRKNLVVALAAVLFLVPLSPVLVHAGPFDSAKDAACKGLNFDDPTATCAAGSKDAETNAKLKTAVNLLSAIVGVVAVVMIIIAGMNFITAGGDSGKVSTARNMILYAAIGIVVVALAQLIVRFVLQRFGK